MKLNRELPPEGTVRDWLASRAETGGTAIVFPETGTSISWEDLQADAIAFAKQLTGMGAAKSESVAIVSPNSREAVVAFYGVVIGGFRATMINLAAGRDAISYALEHSEARYAYVHPDCRALFDEANATNVEPNCRGIRR